MAEQATVEPTTETEQAQALENNAVAPVATGADSTAAELQARLAEAEKKAQQAEMRAKQLENERVERERKEMEEQGRWQEIAEKNAQELEELRQQREMDQLMAGYDPKIQEVAKKLFSAGDLPSQLAALQEAIKQNSEPTPEPEVPQPKVEPLNPNPRGSEPSILQPGMSLEEEADLLDKRLRGAGL